MVSLVNSPIWSSGTRLLQSGKVQSKPLQRCPDIELGQFKWSNPENDSENQVIKGIYHHTTNFRQSTRGSCLLRQSTRTTPPTPHPTPSPTGRENTWSAYLISDDVWCLAGPSKPLLSYFLKGNPFAEARFHIFSRLSRAIRCKIAFRERRRCENFGKSD